jgi:L,D-transpeptidase YbiS
VIDLTDPIGSELDAEPAPRRFRIRVRARPPRPRPALALALALVAFAVVAVGGTGYRYAPLGPQSFDAALGPGAPAEPARVQAEQRKLRNRLAAAAPKGIYIVVDRTNNKLRLVRDGRVELDATCSAGSGSILSDSTGERTWVFDTPRGEFTVRHKTKNPVWRKPDWAFVEEGEPIPEDPGERIEYGTLGEYALYLGDGYMIHGTLYERLLGRNVTHGCIRLGREDLRRVNAEAPVGTPVFIY